MDSIVNKIAIEVLKQNGIIPEKTGLIYYGENNFILPVQLNGKIYYFKFFPNINIDKLKAEIIFTKFLRENGIDTPLYFKQGDREIFEAKYNSMEILFFATEHIDADIEPDITPELLIDIIKNIAKIHMQTRKFDKRTINIEKVTDYQNLFTYYILHREFWEKYGMDEFIEKAIQLGDEKKDTFPIHSDLHTANIMTENGRVKSFIDFGDLRESYFEDDLGKFFQNLVGAKGINLSGIKRLISLYEKETETKVSKKNIYISMTYHIMERFYIKTQSQENPEYTEKIKHILGELSEEIENLEQVSSMDEKNDEGR